MNNWNLIWKCVFQTSAHSGSGQWALRSYMCLFRRKNPIEFSRTYCFISGYRTAGIRILGWGSVPGSLRKPLGLDLPLVSLHEYHEVWREGPHSCWPFLSQSSAFVTLQGYIATRLFSRRACFILKMEPDYIMQLEDVGRLAYEKQVTAGSLEKRWLYIIGCLHEPRLWVSQWMETQCRLVYLSPNLQIQDIWGSTWFFLPLIIALLWKKIQRRLKQHFVREI